MDRVSRCVTAGRVTRIGKLWFLVASYYGVPLYDAKGQMLGTVCHFDTSPIRVTDEVASALDDLSRLIADAEFSAK